ncbi:flagellar hook-length control protein FliK, partial [Geoalkalibacter sp.]|uniref:flagellar hook-length control protein FliK n=1 Tax=Geoalkalibacter sp. TaxID=3041440 RepID=UPI00272EB4E8
NGTLLPDNQLLNQVVERLSLRGQGEGSRMTLRLHPEELGELRMELLMEKGVLKAQILAQNPQVQEVLERNLYRLREALEGQGLKLESCEVGLDNRQQGEGREWFGARQQPQPAAPHRLAARITPVDIAPPRQAGLNGAGGISLRI